MTSNDSFARQSGNLLKLADLRYRRQLALLAAQLEEVSTCVARLDRSQAQLDSCQSELDELRDERVRQNYVKASELFLKLQIDADCQQAIQWCLGQVALHQNALEDAKIRLHELQRGLHQMKLRTEALRDKIERRLADAQRFRQGKLAELAEDEFSQREPLS